MPKLLKVDQPHLQKDVYKSSFFSVLPFFLSLTFENRKTSIKILQKDNNCPKYIRKVRLETHF